MKQSLLVSIALCTLMLASCAQENRPGSAASPSVDEGESARVREERLAARNDHAAQQLLILRALVTELELDLLGKESLVEAAQEEKRPELEKLRADYLEAKDQLARIKERLEHAERENREQTRK